MGIGELYEFEKTGRIESVGKERSLVGQVVRGNVDYFERLGREGSIAKLAEHEKAGTLDAFMKEVAPDYVNAGGEALKFDLIVDMGW